MKTSAENRRLRRLVWLSISLGALAACAAVVTILALRQDSIEQSAREQAGLATVFGQEISVSRRAIEGVLDDVEALIKQKAPRDAAEFRVALGTPEISARLRGEIHADSTIELVTLADATGGIVSSSRGWPAPTANVSHESHFVYLSDHVSKETFVSSPERSRVSGEMMLFFGRRLDAPDGKFLGIAHVGVNMKSYASIYTSIRALNNKGILIAKKDGTVLFRFPSIADHVEPRMPSGSPWWDLVAGGGGEYVSPGYFDGVSRLIAVHPLPECEFVVNVSQSMDSVLATWRFRAAQIGLGAILDLLCAGLLMRSQFYQFRTLLSSETELKATSEANALLNARFSEVLGNMPHGVAMFSSDRRLIVANKRYGEMYDLSPEDVRPGKLLEEILASRVAKGIFVRNSADYMKSRLTDVMSDAPRQSLDRLSNGRVIFISRRPIAMGGWLTVHEDVTARQLAEDKIESLALYDQLTGAANRVLLLRELGRRLESQDSSDNRIAVLLLDLDEFKAVNDTYGHPFGDALLRAVAGRLKEIVGERGLVARFGGDEFATLAFDDSGQNTLAGELLERMRDPFEIEGYVLTVRPSIGVARAPRDGADVETLLKKADLALYSAKTEGRDRVREFEPELDRDIRERRVLKAEMADAIAQGQFEVHYQPIVEARTARTLEVEALVRWRHPERGMIRPDHFIKLAEQTGQIQAIGAFVLREACRAATSFPDEIGVSVNLSPAQFGRGDLVAFVSEVLAETGLAPSRLTLEVTETALIENIASSRCVLTAIRALGVRIALDDFGTGYSSLSYLQSFALDKIKIDRSFVMEMETNARTRTIVALIASIAGSLGATTVAEGFETQAQLDLVVAAGCQSAQGYYFSRPVPLSALEFSREAPAERAAA